MSFTFFFLRLKKARHLHHASTGPFHRNCILNYFETCIRFAIFEINCVLVGLPFCSSYGNG